MSLQDTPQGERFHIVLLGKSNAGKSSLFNALTGQSLAIVSDTKGTTTDPVYKAMELLPLGPVVWIDTAGLDDTGEFAQERKNKTRQALRKADLGLLVMDAQIGMTKSEQEWIQEMKARKIPYLLVYHKKDLCTENTVPDDPQCCATSIYDADSILACKQKIISLLHEEEKKPLVKDLVRAGDLVVLVVPIDTAAPKGRLILPQQQVIRELLEEEVSVIVTKETNLKQTLSKLTRDPDLVITDSQVFAQVAQQLATSIRLTSFSILFSRYKGDLQTQLAGIQTIAHLQQEDVILIAEGCTHHRQCDDIGTVKIPNWLQQKTGKKLQFQFVSGTEFPTDLTSYALIVHCGGCMLNKKEMQYRLETAKKQGVAMVNYGLLIADCMGVLQRSIQALEQRSGK